MSINSQRIIFYKLFAKYIEFFSSMDRFASKESRKTIFWDILFPRTFPQPRRSFDVEGIKDDYFPRNSMIRNLNHFWKAALQRLSLFDRFNGNMPLVSFEEIQYLNMQNALPERAKTKNHFSLEFTTNDMGFVNLKSVLMCYLLPPEQSVFI